MNNRPTVGVIGYGFVGSAVAHGFNPVAEIRCYDNDPLRSTHSLDETLASDFLFLCLPTPQSDDGSCDTSIIEGFCESVRGLNKPIVLKSTVPPGTTDRLAETYNLPGLVHSPEFLTARTAIVDFITPARIIIGENVRSETYQRLQNLKAVECLFARRFPGVQIVTMRAVESELVKYGCNCFFATKLSFFNELKQIVDASPWADWNTVMRGVMSDGRIAHSHTDVPGPDGSLGWGGSCFPKDSSALASYAKRIGVQPLVLNGAIAKNAEVRG